MLLSSTISSTCPHNMVNFGLLSAEIISLVWGTPANFKGFCVLSSLLQRRRSTEANQTLHGVWPSPGLVHYIYIFGGSCSVTEFWQVQNSLCILQVLRCHILVALLHGTWAVGASQTLRRWAQGATYIRQATITLGIGPHSSIHKDQTSWWNSNKITPSGRQVQLVRKIGYYAVISCYMFETTGIVIIEHYICVLV